jgi:putative phosphoesterase
MEIALISDNHGYDGHDILSHIEGCDEVWHAGDIGNLASLEKIEAIAPIRGVYGNIDDRDVRAVYPLDQIWTVNGMKVVMTHIGNYPPKYYKRIRHILKKEKPHLYICGHSHICRVMPDRDLNLLHMNPGAYGHHGFHKMRTMLRFRVGEGRVHDVRVVELGLRGIKHSTKPLI